MKIADSINPISSKEIAKKYTTLWNHRIISDLDKNPFVHNVSTDSVIDYVNKLIGKGDQLIKGLNAKGNQCYYDVIFDGSFLIINIKNSLKETMLSLDCSGFEVDFKHLTSKQSKIISEILLN